MADYIDWAGQTGSLYRYWFLLDPSPSGIVSQSGNYMFVKQTNMGWVPVYIGESDDLRVRLPNHPEWQNARMHGATHIMAHTTPAGDGARKSEEADLISRWNPPLNVHHRTGATPFVAGR